MKQFFTYSIVFLFGLLFGFLSKCQHTPKITAEQAKIVQHADSLFNVIDVSNLKAANEWRIISKTPPTAEIITKKEGKTETRITVISDTIRNIVNLTDTIPKKFVQVDSSTGEARLKLPYVFAVRDSFIALSGKIEVKKIMIDSLLIFNKLLLSERKIKSFATETTNLMISNSNPYISNIVPTYTFQRPTARVEWLYRAASFAVGIGVGYAIRELRR